MQKIESYLQVFTEANEHIGHFDGEFFYTEPSVNLKVDGIEVYTIDIPCEFIGYIKNNRIQLLDGSVPYYFTD